MDEEIKKEWTKFLRWVYKAHQLTMDWRPDFYSIAFWEEYKWEEYKKGGKQ